MSAVSAIDDKREPKPKANSLVDALLNEAGYIDKLIVPKLFVQFTGSLTAAAMLNQVLYWHDKGDLPNNWIYKSDAMWAEELCISKYAAEQARNVLRRMGLIRTKVVRAPNGTPMHHHQCNLNQVNKLWKRFLADPDAWAEELKGGARIVSAA